MARSLIVILLGLAVAAPPLAAQSLWLDDVSPQDQPAPEQPRTKVQVATAQPAAAPAQEGQQHPLGAYDGVAPNSANPPAMKIAPGTTPPQATWPGFQMLANGGSRFFVQVTSKPEFAVGKRPDQVVVTLKNVQIAGRNNQYSLETRFFNTPVNRAYLKPQGADTAMVLELRTDQTPIVTSKLAPTGYYFVILDFPAGRYLTESPNKAPAAEPEQPTASFGNVGGETLEPTVARSGVSASANVSTSGRAAAPRASKGSLSAEEMRTLDAERPPPIDTGKAKAAAKFGR